MKNPRLLLTLALLLGWAAVFSQSSKVVVQSPKAWVEPITFDAAAAPPAGQERSVYYLLLDEQENFQAQESFTHYAYKILTSEGLQDMSDMSISFDPAYQQLIMHTLRIHRNGKVIDQMPRTFQTIQREQSMDRYVYDGALTTVVNMSDVRVGDVIEYAFTRKGYNPVHRDNIDRTFSLNYSQGVAKCYQRITLPASRTVTLKNINTEQKPVITEANGTRTYTWTIENIPALVTDDNVPEWYNPYQVVLMSGFEDWTAVGRWASRLFTVSESDKKALHKAALEQFTGGTKEEYAQQVIRFVQDEVRYLGFETGLNTHQPYPPLKVYTRRFGDCKDKSLLLVTLLAAKDIEAHPVLVNTQLRGHVREQLLPSAYAFDHCVVEINLGGKRFYIDPTRSGQGGKLKAQYFPAFGEGLVLNNQGGAFALFGAAGEASTTEIHTYTLPAIGGEAALEVKTVYRGAEADYARAQFAGNSLEEIQKNYLKFYGNQYPSIEKVEPLKYTDDREENTFTVDERYRVAEFWKVNKEDADVSTCTVYAQSLDQYLSVSKFAQRTAPYALNYPVDYSHIIQIHLPEEWSVEEERVDMDRKEYTFFHSTKYAENTLLLTTNYTVQAPYIEAAEYERFVQDHQKMAENMSYTLTYDKKIVSAASRTWPGLLVGLLAVGGGIALVLWLYYRYDPTPAYSTEYGEQIGGWLVLVSIGLMISPFLLVNSMVEQPELMSGELWMSLFAMGRPGLAIFILFEQVYNIVQILFLILALVLFFQRRSSTPRIVSIFYGVSCLATILDTVVANVLIESAVVEPEDNRDLIRGIIAAAIWIPYFNMSDRVKRTFVFTLRKHDLETPADTTEPAALSDATSEDQLLRAEEPGATQA
jgi:transglutaminase-like putative cysteine protease